MSTEEGLMDKDANHAQEASGSRDVETIGHVFVE